MNGFFQRRNRFEWSVLAGGALLLLLYAAVFWPLTRRAEGLNVPLTNAWNRLVTNSFAIPVEPTDFAAVQRTWREAKEQADSLERLRGTIEARLQLESAIRERMDQPFKLIDFQNDRQVRLEELFQLAQQKGVTLDPGIQVGFPRFAPDLRKPDLLWAQLGVANQLVRLAIESGIIQVQSVQSLPFQTRTWSGVTTETLETLPVRIEVVGEMPAISRMLAALPLAAQEAQELGLPAGGPEKPALFIDHILIRKVAPERPDEVQLILRAVGFVYRSDSAARS